MDRGRHLCRLVSIALDSHFPGKFPLGKIPSGHGRFLKVYYSFTTSFTYQRCVLVAVQWLCSIIIMTSDDSIVPRTLYAYLIRAVRATLQLRQLYMKMAGAAETTSAGRCFLSTI